jgi:hypothetical protein
MKTRNTKKKEFSSTKLYKYLGLGCVGKYAWTYCPPENDSLPKSPKTTRFSTLFKLLIDMWKPIIGEHGENLWEKRSDEP